MRLRRSRLDLPGYTRVRAGKGFRWRAPDGGAVTTEENARLRALVVPPAWTDVWVCPWPNGHIQAIGVDAAGRRQYRYHDDWRRTRDARKHERILTVARSLPALREHVMQDLDRRGAV